MYLQMFEIQKFRQRLNHIASHLNVVRVQRDHLFRAVVQRDVTFVVQTEHVHSEVSYVIVCLSFNVV